VPRNDGPLVFPRTPRRYAQTVPFHKIGKSWLATALAFFRFIENVPRYFCLRS
jgi:hypothetical protein